MAAWVSKALRWGGVALALCLPVACSSSAGAGGQPAGEEPLAPYILSAVSSMPVGGGYAADRAAELRLAQSGIRPSGSGQLTLSPEGASPTFCSAACYTVLLRALQAWEQARGVALPASAWHSLRVEPVHPDGYLSWGRANANGPGFAKWVRDLGAGRNFTSLQAARPGDFLKFFHTPQIGARERGHLVIYLGQELRGGQRCIRYWSANKPGGYGVRSVPLAGLHHLIFTRITHPARFARAPLLPALDPWLASLLHQDTSFDECSRRMDD